MQNKYNPFIFPNPYIHSAVLDSLEGQEVVFNLPIEGLPPSAERLLVEIHNEKGFALASDFQGKPGWAWLLKQDLLNQWEDDTGVAYVEIGPQM